MRATSVEQENVSAINERSRGTDLIPVTGGLTGIIFGTIHAKQDYQSGKFWKPLPKTSPTGPIRQAPTDVFAVRGDYGAIRGVRGRVVVEALQLWATDQL